MSGRRASDGRTQQFDQTAHSIGDQALSATWDRLADGGTITISTDGTHDFGEEGPTLLFRQTFEDVDDGGDVPADAGGGVGSVERARGTVEDAADLPYGKGQAIGDGAGGGYKVLYDKADEFYEHYYLQWPDAHQDAAEDEIENLQDVAGWQVKGIWHFLGDGGNGGPDANDLFSGSPLLYTGADPSYWTKGNKIISNSKPTSTFSQDPSGLRDPDDRTRWRSEAIHKQLWVKCGPENGEATGSDGMLRHTSLDDGEVAYEDYEEAGYWTDERHDETGFDRFTSPGYTRGFDYNERWHLYYSDIYQTAGPGAAARVEVTDSDVYRESNRLTVCTVQSWSSTEVTAEIVEGIFHDDTLEGKHLWLTDANNESLYVGQLSAGTSVTATGETIQTGGTATLSLDAESVDTITVENLWTDWSVTVDNPAGATTTDDRVSTAGEFELQWDSAQESVAPSLTISPPAETYVGGTYAVEVVVDGGGESDTDTALVEIDDSGTFTLSTEDGITADGTVSDGSKITIQDDQQRFGTKSTQAPHMFDRQSDGQLVNGNPKDLLADVDNGDPVPVGDGYTFENKDGDPRLGDPRGESPPSSGRSGWYYAKPNETDQKDNWLSKVVGWPDPDEEDPPKPRRQVYVSWLMRTNWNLYSGEPYEIDDPGGSAKVHRIWADDEANRGNGYRFSWTRMHATLLRVGDDPGDNVEPYPSWTETAWNDFERWHRLEIEIDYRDGGYTRCYVDGELLHDISILETNPEWVGSISPRLWGYNPSVSDWERPGMVMELADYYVDSSLARVVLTNAESWADSDRRVTQPHFSWAEGELEIELYEGVLAEVDTVYLWVVDENGEPTRVGTLSRKANSTDGLDGGA